MLSHHFLRFAILLTLLYLGSFGAAQTVVAKELDLNTLGNVPAVIEVSPNFLTIIEFEGMSVESAQSGRPDQLVVEPFDNIVTIRAATPETVNTDLFVRVAGRTALFKLVSAPDAENPRRYIVRDKKPFDRGLQGNSLPGGLTKPDNDDVPPPPPGLEFKVSAYRPNPEAVVVQYAIVNNTEHPFVNDPQRLRIYQDNVTKFYERIGSPVPGQPGRLSIGDSEPGQIVIPGVPANASSLELEWILVEVGPGTVYRQTVDLLAALGEKMPDSSDFTAPPTEGTAPPPEGETAAESETATDSEPPAESELPTENEVDSSGAAPTFASVVTPELQSVGVGEELTFSVEVTAEAGRLEGGILNFEIFASDNVSVEQQFLDDIALSEGDTLSRTFTWTPPETGIYTARVGVFRNGWDETLYWNDRASTVTVADSSAEADAARAPETEGDTGAPGRAEDAGAPPTPDAALVREDFEGESAREVWTLHAQVGTESRRIFENGEACANVAEGGEEPWSLGFAQTGIPLEQGQTYLFRFDAYANKPITFRPAITLSEAPWTEFVGRVETLGPQAESFSYEFEMEQSSEDNRLIFFIGANENTPYSVCFDNVELVQSGAQLSGAADEEAADENVGASADVDSAGVVSSAANGDARASVDNTILVSNTFDGKGGTEGWWRYITEGSGAAAERVAEDGAACLNVAQGGEELQHVQFGYSEIPLETDQPYRLNFDAYADKPTEIYATVGIDQAPWTNYFGWTERLDAQKQSYEYDFRAPQISEMSRIIFRVGGGSEPYRVCFDNIMLIAENERSSEASNPAQSLDKPSAPLGAALLVVGADKPNEVDPMFRTRLEQLGWGVTVIDDTSVADTDLAAAGIVVVSPSVNSGEIDLSLRDVAVPVVTSEEKLFAPLGMTGDAESIYFGESEGYMEVQLTSADHPLRAGLSGTVSVSEGPYGLAWGAPSPNAVVVATVPGDSTKAAVFAYEADAPMIGMTAPERRVGLFHDYEVAYSEDAWTLFDAAVRWAAHME